MIIYSKHEKYMGVMNAVKSLYKPPIPFVHQRQAVPGDHLPGSRLQSEVPK